MSIQTAISYVEDKMAEIGTNHGLALATAPCPTSFGYSSGKIVYVFSGMGKCVGKFVFQNNDVNDPRSRPQASWFIAFATYLLPRLEIPPDPAVLDSRLAVRPAFSSFRLLC